MKSSLIDASIWQELREFGEGDDNSDFFSKLLFTFLTAGKNQMTELLASSAANDKAKTHYFAHTLKSTCATLGALSLAEQFAQIEAECHPTGPGISKDHIAAAHKVFEVLFVEVQTEFQKLLSAAS